MHKLASRNFLLLIAGLLGFILVVSLSLIPIVSQAQSFSQCPAEASAAGESGENLCPEAASPEAAYVWRVSQGSANEPAAERVIYRPDEEDQRRGTAGQLVYETNKILVKGGNREAGALLRFTTTRTRREAFAGLIDGYLAAAGFSADVNDTAIYVYPCAGIGSYAIGWESTSANETGPPCHEVAFNRTLRGFNDYVRGNADEVGPGTNSLTKEHAVFDKQIANERPIALGDVAPIHLRQFCSVAAPGTLNWQVKLASRAASEIGDVCEQALTECQKEAGAECLIIRQGFWRSISPNPDLRQIRLQFRCSNTSNFLPYDEIVGSNDIYDEWAKLEKRARDSEAKGCVLSIYNRDDILVAPDPDQRTLVHFDDDRDELVVTTLVGTATVTQPGNINALMPTTVEAGHQFVLSYDDYSGIDTALEDSDKKDIYYLPIIQAFQNPDLWEQLYSNDPIKEQIQNFRAAIAAQFWQPPATGTELINGIWRATITLQPNINLRLVPDTGVTNANRLESFAAANNNPDLILGGLFQSPSFLASECRALRSGRGYATILGLTADSQPEMISGGGLDGRTPAFDDYCFAITGGPRLLQASNPNYRITPEAARAQSHTDPNFTTVAGINRRSARSAVCISRDRSALYYAATPSGVSLSLPEFAAILGSDEFGCGDAMNMDGGNPQVLYFPEGDGAPGLPPTGTAPPYWILVYDDDV